MCLYFSSARSCDAHELLLFLGLLTISSNMASVGGRRRKPAEEQCAELQARARQAIIRAGRKEVEDMEQKFPHTSTPSSV